MTAIEPIGTEEATERGLSKLMETYTTLGDEAATFPRILANAPGYAEAIIDAMNKAHLHGDVDIRLKEMMRIQLARTAGDPYFSSLRSKAALEAGLTEERIDAASGDFDNDGVFTDAEKWALRYSHLMYREPDKVDAAFYEEGKQHFTEAQIMEMGGLIAVHYGMQVFMSTLQN